MKSKSTLMIAASFIIILNLLSCNKKTSANIDLDNQTDTIASTGSMKTVSFNCNGSWSIDTTGLGWLKISPASGDAGDASINISVSDTNKTGASRTKLLYLSSANELARRINIFQPAYIFPSYNTSPAAPDASGMGSTATQLIAKLKLGT